MLRSSRLAIPLALALAAATASAAAEEFQIVVHPSVGGSGVRRQVLAAVFMGAVERWGNGTEARPVDQSSRASVRRAFTTQVLGQSVGDIQQHWWRQVSQRHVLPPPVKASDEEVLAYVASQAGAIGYISPDVPIPPTVRKVVLLD